MDDNAVTLFDMKLAHVGLNAKSSAAADEVAEQFAKLLGLPKRETTGSYFSGELVEIMKENGRGCHGHIGFVVNNCEKAMEYFTAKGMSFIEETKKVNADGICTFAYFKEEIGGFAIHLIQA